MANVVAQNADLLRSFSKRQSDEDSTSDRDSVASTIRRRTSEQGRTMVPLTSNGVSGFSPAPVTEGRLGGQGRPMVMIPLRPTGVPPTLAGTRMNTDESWTTVMGRRLPTAGISDSDAAKHGDWKDLLTYHGYVEPVLEDQLLVSISLSL